MHLSNQAISFSQSILNDWLKDQPQSYDSKTVQQQLIYSLASGAVRSLSSFSLLEEHGITHDLPIISRILLERYVKADFARRSETNAVALMIYEATKNIRKLELLRDLPSGDASGLQKKIDELHDDKITLERLVSPDYPTNLSEFELFKNCDLESVYRSSYHWLSRSVHSGFHSGYTEVTMDPVMKFYALMTPVETSNFLHMLRSGIRHEDYDALRKDITDACFNR